MRGIPPPDCFRACPARKRARAACGAGGNMGRTMAAPERQLSLHKKKPDSSIYAGKRRKQTLLPRPP